MQPTAPPTTAQAPRKRRRRWKILAGFALLALATPICAYFIAGWLGERRMEEIYRELDAEDPNWRWHDLLKELEHTAPPDDENAALQLVKINGLLKKTPFDPGAKWNNAVKDPLSYRNARLKKEQADLLRTAFDKLDPSVMVEARKLKDMPRGCFVMEAVDKPFFQLNLDYIQQTRGVMQLLQLDAALRAQENDCDGAIESGQGILNTAAALKDQPTLIALLVRCAGQSIAVAAIEHTLGQGTVSEANLQKLQKLLEREVADDGLHAAMRGERAGGHQMYEQLRSGRISLSGLMGGPGARPSSADRLLDTFPGLILSGYPDHLRTMTETVRATKLKDAERAEAMRKVEDAIKEKRTILTRMIMPATVKVSQATQRTQAGLRCAAVGTAAERYRLKHERWPNKLDDLVQAGLLKEVPKDPYDGQPLRMTRTPTGFIVYSVGMDLVDNGGKLDRANPRTPNTDLGFELWDDFPGRRLRGVAPPVE